MRTIAAAIVVFAVMISHGGLGALAANLDAENSTLIEQVEAIDVVASAKADSCPQWVEPIDYGANLAFAPVPSAPCSSADCSWIMCGSSETTHLSSLRELDQSPTALSATYSDQNTPPPRA